MGSRTRAVFQRQLPAKRLGRITGGGLFAESQKLGEEAGWTEQQILGCDSVQTVLHNGKLFWGWGDTTLAKYPLGRFHMIGATTSRQPLRSFEPPVRLRYDYFTDAQGAFPVQPPDFPVLWVVKGKTRVPWGQRVQLN